MQESESFLKWAPASAFAAVALTVAVVCVRPFRAGFGWMDYLQDDCFYYLTVARNLASGHGSTFNGIVPTNGYHPLWLLVLTACRMAFPRTVPLVYIAVIVALMSLVTFFLARWLLARTSASPLIVNALSAFIVAFSMQLYFTGMEVLLTVPLALLFLVLCVRPHRTPRGFASGIGLGLVVSAMVLSRLDSILLGALVAFALLVNPQVRQSWKEHRWQSHVCGLLVGLSPLVLYVASNQIWFHTWMPVSGMAKQLKTNHWPSFPAWRSFLIFLAKHAAVSIPVFVAAAILPKVWRRLSPVEQSVYTAVLAWPVVYVAVLSCVSDWMLWTWYFYPMRPVFCVALIILCRWGSLERLLRHRAVAVAVVLVCCFKLFTLQWPRGEMPMMIDVGQRVAAFAGAHTGTYAMGDRAGAVGYLMPQPVVQTEGLMMDRPFVDTLRDGGSLRRALATYGVRYYVATELPFSSGLLRCA